MGLLGSNENSLIYSDTANLMTWDLPVFGQSYDLPIET